MIDRGPGSMVQVTSDDEIQAAAKVPKRARWSRERLGRLLHMSLITSALTIRPDSFARPIIGYPRDLLWAQLRYPSL